jgi:SanA protein
LRIRRLIKRWLLLGFAAFVLLVLLSNRWVINSTDAYVFEDWSLIPANEVGIVLGTSAYTKSGALSADFRGRIDAAAQLYELGKVRHLVVSGANPDSTYNEPRRMWQELVKKGVPASAITMDFAGYRTLDSVSRAKAVFGLERFTLVTQKYHTYRAVFIGRKMGLDAIAYVAPGTEFRHPTREVFARVKAVLDLFLLRTTPKFLGEPVDIELERESAEPQVT